MAVVVFICDPDLTGLETDFVPEDKYKGSVEKRALDGSAGNLKASLTYVAYDRNVPDSDTDVLHLEWRTKYACESQGDDRAQRSHWGFFTWFLIM
jgi:hypothetical protein